MLEASPSLHGTFWCWTRPGFLGRLLLGTLGPLSRLPLAHFGGFGIVTTAAGEWWGDWFCISGDIGFEKEVIIYSQIPSLSVVTESSDV